MASASLKLFGIGTAIGSDAHPGMRLVRAFGFYGSASLINALSKFAILSIGARVVAASDYGLLDSAIVGGLVVANILLLGIDTAIIRFAFDEKTFEAKRRIFASCAAIVGVNTGFLCLVAIVMALGTDGDVLGFPAELTTFVVKFAIGSAAISVSVATLRALLLERTYFLLSASSAVFRVAIAAAFLIVLEASLTGYLAWIGNGQLAVGLVCLLVTARNFDFRAMDTGRIAPILKFSLPIAGILVAVGIGQTVERSLVLTQGGELWLSIFASSAFPAMLLAVGSQILSAAWVPIAMEQVVRGNHTFVRTTGALIVVALTFAMAVLALIAAPLMAVLAPLDIPDQTRLFPVIGTIFLLRAVGGVTSFSLFASKRSSTRMMLATGNVACGAALGTFLGSWFGVWHVPTGFLLSAFVFWAIEAFVSYRNDPRNCPPLVLMAVVMSIALSAALSVHLGSTP